MHQSKMTSRSKELVSLPLWMPLWSLGLACAWLIPNHYRPWASFHAEAWSAFLLLLMVLSIALKRQRPIGLSWPSLGLLATGAIVWLQFAAGQIWFSGQAWLTFGFLSFGALACIGAAALERDRPNQAGDALFAAVALAAFLSIGLQLDQWLHTELFDIWSMGGDGSRPYANIGQPNLLSTFLVWGLLSLIWAGERGTIGSITACFGAAILLFGVALTQSRTGWLCLLFVYVVIFAWRRQWRWRRLPHAATLLGLLFVTCVVGLRDLSQWMQVGAPPQLDGRLALASDLRLSAWKLFFQSSLEHPWIGYGFGNIHLAQIEAPPESIPVYQPFGEAHNLLLDLILSLGWPLGLVCFGALLYWLWRRALNVANSLDVVLLLFLGVVGIHSLLELPLHHAHYFLPACMVIGILGVRQGVCDPITVPQKSIVVASAFALAGHLVFVSDYLRTEASFTRLRFEWNRIGLDSPGGPPDVYILDQLRQWMIFLRFEPTRGMSEAQLRWMRDVTMAFPSAGNFFKLARALALNGRPGEAEQRLVQMCNVSERRQCKMISDAWQEMAKGEPALASVHWPSSPN